VRPYFWEKHPGTPSAASFNPPILGPATLLYKPGRLPLSSRALAPLRGPPPSPNRHQNPKFSHSGEKGSPLFQPGPTPFRRTKEFYLFKVEASSETGTGGILCLRKRTSLNWKISFRKGPLRTSRFQTAEPLRQGSIRGLACPERYLGNFLRTLASLLPKGPELRLLLNLRMKLANRTSPLKSLRKEQFGFREGGKTAPRLTLPSKPGTVLLTSCGDCCPSKNSFCI